MRTNRRWMAAAMGTVLGALALAGLSSPAAAQDYEPVQLKKAAVKVGAFIPTNGGLKSDAGSTWWYVGLDYFPGFRHRLANADVGFGADLRFRDSGKVSLFSHSLGAKALWDISPEGSPVVFRAGLGAGIYFSNTKHSGGMTNPGLKFIFSVDLSQRLFVEVNYDWVSGFTDSVSKSIRVDGLTVSAGVRY